MGDLQRLAAVGALDRVGAGDGGSCEEGGDGREEHLCGDEDEVLVIGKND